MRQILFALSMLLCAALLGCVSEKKNAIEGTWRLVSGKQSTADTTFTYTEANCRSMKMIYDNHLAFMTRWFRDKDTVDGYGGGAYTLEGNNYTERIEYSSRKESIGDVIPFEVEVINDTLIQKGPRKIGKYQDTTWELHEVWVRMK